MAKARHGFSAADVSQGRNADAAGTQLFLSTVKSRKTSHVPMFPLCLSRGVYSASELTVLRQMPAILHYFWGLLQQLGMWLPGSE